LRADGGLKQRGPISASENPHGNVGIRTELISRDSEARR
jgi:hypothetical protein